MRYSESSCGSVRKLKIVKAVCSSLVKKKKKRDIRHQTLSLFSQMYCKNCVVGGVNDISFLQKPFYLFPESKPLKAPTKKTTRNGSPTGSFMECLASLSSSRTSSCPGSRSITSERCVCVCV